MFEEKLRPCPFCGGEAKLQLTDDEGNFKDESYLEDTYSGVGYVIVHDISNSTRCCPIATYSDRRRFKEFKTLCTRSTY